MEIQMKPIIFLFVGCCCLSLLTGCGTKYPADFPVVYPMTVTVTDGGTPLADVQLMFYPVSLEAGAGYAVSAHTDTRGIAKVSTSQGAYAKAGIPAREYVVTVADIIRIDLGITPEEAANMTYADEARLARKENELLAAYKKKVPEALNKRAGNVEDRSPLRYTVVEGKNEWTIDVAPYKNF